MNLLRYTILMLLVTITGFSLQAQTEKSDPKATAILKKVKAKYEAYSTLLVDFSLQIQSEDANRTISGKAYQKGEQYRVEMDDYHVVSDGATVWFHLLGTPGEVTITNANDEDADMISPSSLLKIYDKDDFIYAITGNSTINGKAVTLIEFKPTEYNEEVTKVRVAIDTKTNAIVRIIAFGRWGDRYTLNMNKVTPNVKIGASKFSFDTTGIPKENITDLRDE